MAMSARPLKQQGKAIESAEGRKKVAPSPAKAPTKNHGLVSASSAKTHLLALIKQINEDRTPITITKRGHPVARLVFAEQEAVPDIFGCMKGTGRITGDIVTPESDLWEAASE